jgi:Cys-tRNA(Pro) deacylase
VKKTQPIRVLEAKRVAFKALEQSRNEYTAEGVAADLGVVRAQVLKAMLVCYKHPDRPSPGGSFALFATPGDRRLSLKKVGEVLGDKNADLAIERDVERITGFQVGAVSVVGLRREDTPRYLDQRILELSEVVISAGRPDMGLKLSPDALVIAIDSLQVGDFCE